MEPANFGDRVGAADGRHRAPIEIVERFGPLTANHSADVGRGGLALLNGDWRDPRQHLAVGFLQRGEVAHDEDFRMTRDAEVRSDGYAAASIHLSADLPTARRRGHAGGPPRGV